MYHRESYVLFVFKFRVPDFSGSFLCAVLLVVSLQIILYFLKSRTLQKHILGFSLSLLWLQNKNQNKTNGNRKIRCIIVITVPIPSITMKSSFRCVAQRGCYGGETIFFFVLWNHRAS